MAVSSGKHKILFFTSSLGGGGAEKHLLRLLNNADFESFDVHLMLSRKGGSYEQFLSERIKIHYLTTKTRTVFLSWIISIFEMKKIIQRLEPDLICAVMDAPNLVMMISDGLYNYPAKKVLCCQNNLSDNYQNASLNIIIGLI